MSDAPTNPLRRPVVLLHGVGPERAALLSKLGIQTVEDLLLHAPRRYEDRRRFCAVRELQPGRSSVVRGKIVAAGVKYWKKRSHSVFEFILDDGTARLHCRWWNLPYMERYFTVGDEVLVFGKLKSLKPHTMDHPETEVLNPAEENSVHMNRIAPVYPLTEGVAQRWLRALVWRTLAENESHIAEPHPEITLPDLPTRARALRLLHFPEESTDAEMARGRLALDEVIELQLAIQRRRKNLEANAAGLPCAGTNLLMKKFLATLGFPLTAAQTRVLRELRGDMGGKHPMRRLLQGDVGSGKTVVAACTALMALESGFNAALMAPTEILAEQHYRNFKNWLDPLGVGVALLTGSVKTVAGGVEGRGASTLFIGTHALIEGSFAPEKLGLVIIDEQHKFGVAQRETLVRKGRYPHLLVMTATPIPRTLGLTLYGDLDVSTIDEMPSGRGRIKTHVRSAEKLPKVLEFIREKLAKGQQAYVVYPRVEEADLKTGVKAVTQEFEKLQKEFAPHRVGLLHGRLKAEEKERVMAEFRASRLQVLLATSVIEVGVDVPNATVMLIESAEQFGLAQLHQLRGRIGRGAHDSHCILLANIKTDEARQRLRVMEQTTDGFQIAEADLRLRGPGEFLGQAQSGLPPFRFADLSRDVELVQRARKLVAFNIL